MESPLALHYNAESWYVFRSRLAKTTQCCPQCSTLNYVTRTQRVLLRGNLSSVVFMKCEVLSGAACSSQSSSGQCLTALLAAVEPLYTYSTHAGNTGGPHDFTTWYLLYKWHRYHYGLNQDNVCACRTQIKKIFIWIERHTWYVWQWNDCSANTKLEITNKVQSSVCHMHIW